MALSKPILLQQVAFDSNNAQHIKFNVTSGNQVTGNRLKIINNKTGVEVYNQLQITYQLVHAIPQNTLINGTYYAMQVQTIDAQGNTSPWSNTIQFYCYSTPIITFTNLPLSNIINNSIFTFETTYTQQQGELLNSYVYNLYSVNDVLLATSGNKYVGSIVAPPTVLSYRFVGLEDNDTYKIEAIGATQQGTQITTGKITITVDYVSPEIFAFLQLENNCKDGYITLTSNIIDIKSKSYPDPPSYLNHNKVDLGFPNYWVMWDEGFSINNNFTLGIWANSLNEQTEINILSNMQDAPLTPNYISILYRKDYAKYTDTTMSIFAEMYCYSGESDNPYYCFSNFIAVPTANEQVFFWLRRVNNVFELKIENRGVII